MKVSIPSSDHDPDRVPSSRRRNSVSLPLLAASVGYALAVIAALPVPTLRALPVPAGVMLDAALLAAAFTYHRRVLRFASRPISIRVADPQRTLGREIGCGALALIGFFGLWQPLPQVIWVVANSLFVAALWALAGLAALTLLMTAPIVARHAPLARGTRPAAWLTAYRIATLAFSVLAWTTAVMMLGHLVYAAGASGYALWSLWQDTREPSAVRRPRARRTPGPRALRTRRGAAILGHAGHHYAHP